MPGQIKKQSLAGLFFDLGRRAMEIARLMVLDKTDEKMSSYCFGCFGEKIKKNTRFSQKFLQYGFGIVKNNELLYLRKRTLTIKINLFRKGGCRLDCAAIGCVFGEQENNLTKKEG